MGDFMKYSLLSRFQGCLEGMAIADQFSQWMYQGGQTMEFPAQQGGLRPSPWVEQAIQVSEAFIQSNGGTFLWGLDATPKLLTGDNGSTLAIATLPIALFFHDDLSLQQQQLRQTVQGWGGTPAGEDWVALWGYAIAQALNQQLVPDQLIARLRAYLKTTEPNLTQRSPTILSALELLENLLQQGTTSEIATVKIAALLPQEAQAIALALYCFLSTPDWWHLAVTHAARLSPTSPVTCTLTASLSGAYNSHSSLPLGWKVNSPQIVAALPSLKGSPVTWAKLAACLLATWSGMADASPHLVAHQIPVTSPRNTCQNR
jgi:hypothetical protein